MGKLQLVNKQYTITIPQDIIALVKWGKGDIITVSYNERKNLELCRVNQ